MSQRSKIAARRREQNQERQAKKVVNGIFIGLIVLMAALLIVYAVSMA